MKRSTAKAKAVSKRIAESKQVWPTLFKVLRKDTGLVLENWPISILKRIKPFRQFTTELGQFSEITKYLASDSIGLVNPQEWNTADLLELLEAMKKGSVKLIDAAEVSTSQEMEIEQV